MSNQQKVGLVVVALVVGGLVLFVTSGRNSSSPSAASSAAKNTPELASADERASATSASSESSTKGGNAASQPEAVATPDLPHEGGLDPEFQPRKFYVQEFTGLAKPPEGFKMDDTIELTADGFRLKPPAPGEEDKPRQGTIYSPIEPLDFPSNAVSPLWKEDVPMGTDMFAEIQVSPDGETWGDWNWVVLDDDSAGQIAEFFPDGRPNPNYGYTPGGVYAWGDLQWKHLRYKFTLYSENGDSPTLGGVRVFYQDSTMGEGRLAEPTDIAQHQSGSNSQAEQAQ